MKSKRRNLLARKLSISEGGSEQEFMESYRTLLFGQFASMSRMVDDSAAEAEAQRVIQIPLELIDWEDLYNLELAMLRLMPSDELGRLAWSLRNEYHELAADDEWEDYCASDPPGFRKPANPNDPPSEESLLRADLVRLQQEVHWRYIVLWAIEGFRRSVTFRSLLGGLLAIFAFILLGFLGSWWRPHYSFEWRLISLAAAMGVLGGLTTTMRRIQKLIWSGNADTDIAKLGGSMSVYLSPFLGGIFAILLFFMMAGGLIKGDFFPSLDLGKCVHDGLGCPAGSDFAKLIVWSFIAGFAEQLVPDNLARLAGEKSDGK